MLFKAIHLLVLLLSEIAGANSTSPKADAAQQIINIVNDNTRYDKAIMPYPNRTGHLDISTTMFLSEVDIDDVNMVFNVDMTVRLKWQDSRLSHSVPGVDIRFADVSKFWLPGVFFYDSFKVSKMKAVHPEEYIQITNKGDVLYSTRVLLKLRCFMDLHYFPYDAQMCEIMFSSFGFTMKDLVLHFEGNHSVSVGSSFQDMMLFSLEDIKTGTCTTETSTGMYSCVKASIWIKRTVWSYVMKWYLPCILLVAIALCSELLDASNLLPRLLLSLGSLLTLVVCTLNYNQTLGPVPYIRAFDIFNGISVLVVFLTVLHAIAAHAKPGAKDPQPDAEADTKMKKLQKQLRKYADRIVKGLIFGFYGGFLFVYFLTYAT